MAVLINIFDIFFYAFAGVAIGKKIPYEKGKGRSHERP